MEQFKENREISKERPTNLPEVDRLHVHNSCVILDMPQPKETDKSGLFLPDHVKSKQDKEMIGKNLPIVLAVGPDAYNIGLYAGCCVKLKDGASITAFKFEDKFYAQIDSFNVMFHIEPEVEQHEEVFQEEERIIEAN